MQLKNGRQAGYTKYSIAYSMANINIGTIGFGVG